MISIAFFNNKGGVGKTTLLCNFAAFLAKFLQKKVLVIDADPQCNSTTYILNDEQFYHVYFHPTCFTIADIIPPLENGEGYIKQFDTIHSVNFGVDLIPGSPRFATSEDFLANEWRDVKSSDLRGIRSSLVFSHLLSLSTEYDFVLFDMGPSLGAINRAVLLSCDYFLTPMSSDVFSLLALGNISQSLTNWIEKFNNSFSNLEESKQKSISHLRRSCVIKFLGYVEQQYITKTVDGSARAVRAYDEILSKIPKEIQDKIIIPINKAVIPSLDYKIGSIPNYYSLVPMSQTAHQPIFSLTNADGVVGAHYQKVKEFKELMSSVVNHALQNLEAIHD